MSLTEEQKAMRRTGLGGSETAALFGLDKFKRMFDVFTAKVDGWEPEPTEDMWRGELFEDPTAQWYGRKHGVEVINPAKTFRHARRNLILATPDRLLRTSGGELELLSVKVPRSFDEWGEDETQDFPARANVQVQQEAAVLASHGYNLARAWIAAPVWGELRRYPVRLDVELQERIMSGAERWWTKYVAATLEARARGEADVPPPLDGGEGARRWLLSRYPHATDKTKLEATLEQEVLCVALREAEAAREAAAEHEETVKSKLIASLGSAYGLKGSFGSVTYFDNQWGKRTFRARWSSNNRKAA